MVGIWSSEADDITAISETFQVGSALNLLTPQINGPHYLFLANNDGLFDDNEFSYQVTIHAMVSESTTLPLLGLGLCFLGFTRYQKKRATH